MDTRLFTEAKLKEGVISLEYLNKQELITLSQETEDNYVKNLCGDMIMYKFNDYEEYELNKVDKTIDKP